MKGGGLVPEGLFAQIRNIKALEAAVPHFCLQHQKKLQIMIKILEINEICKFYDKAQAAAATVHDENWRQNVIRAVMPHLTESKQHAFKSILQIMEMQDIMNNLEQIKELTQWEQ